jgi:uncharacterized protein
MSSGLPATVDPIRLADARTHLSGELPVTALARLRAMCLDDEGHVDVQLSFERSGEHGLRRIRGKISARVHVACQRCLQALTLELKATPSLLIASAGQRDVLGEEGDVLTVDKPLVLSTLVEDELLLAMPMIPVHDMRECPAGTRFRGQPDDGAAAQGRSPFAVLGSLKRKQS